MSKLNAAERKAIPSSQFAGPDRSFPIPDANHARAALSMAHYANDPNAIRAKVHAAYPSIDDGESPVKKALHRKLTARKGKK